MKQCIKEFFSTPSHMLLFFAAVSAAALGAALISQYAFGLQPCILCLYQRAPFAVIIVLGLVGAILCHQKPASAPFTLAAVALAFITNTVFASYHTGVERHWWKSFLEGCAVPDMKGNITDVLAQIAATPAVRCDEIPWIDPIIGLSMANYNVLLCLVMALTAIYSLRLYYKK